MQWSCGFPMKIVVYWLASMSAANWSECVFICDKLRMKSSGCGFLMQSLALTLCLNLTARTGVIWCWLHNWVCVSGFFRKSESECTWMNRLAKLQASHMLFPSMEVWNDDPSCLCFCLMLCSIWGRNCSRADWICLRCCRSVWMECARSIVVVVGCLFCWQGSKTGFNQFFLRAIRTFSFNLLFLADICECLWYWFIER